MKALVVGIRWQNFENDTHGQQYIWEWNTLLVMVNSTGMLRVIRISKSYEC